LRNEDRNTAKSARRFCSFFLRVNEIMVVLRNTATPQSVCEAQPRPHIAAEANHLLGIGFCGVAV